MPNHIKLIIILILLIVMYVLGIFDGRHLMDGTSIPIYHCLISGLCGFLANYIVKL